MDESRQPLADSKAGLTKVDKQTLLVIKELKDKLGFPPTIQEIADILEIKSSSTHQRVTQLINKGYVKRKGKSPRSLEILKMPEEAKKYE